MGLGYQSFYWSKDSYRGDTVHLQSHPPFNLEHKNINKEQEYAQEMLQVSLLSLFAQHKSWSKTVLPEDMKYIDYCPLTVQEVADRLATGKTIFIRGYISS